MACLNLHCCENPSFSFNIRKLFCCIKPARRRPSKKRFANLCIVFKELNERNIDFEQMFKRNLDEGMVLLFNNNYDIVSANGDSQLFGDRVESLVSLNLDRDLKHFIPISITSMIRDIIDNVKSDRRQRGCQVEISSPKFPKNQFVLGGFPLIDQPDNPKLYGIVIMKKLLSTVLDHNTILNPSSA